MMMFMRTFPILIFIVIFTVLGAYLLNSNQSPMKQAMTAKQNNKIVSLATIPTHQKPTFQAPNALPFEYKEIKLGTPWKDKTEKPATVSKKTAIKPKKQQPTLAKKQTPSLSAPMAKAPDTTEPSEMPKDQTDQPTNDALTTPANAVNNNNQTVQDPNQLTLQEQRDWMTTNLGASDSQLPTRLSVESFAGSPNPFTLTVDDSVIFTFDKTITGSDFSIRFVVMDGILYINTTGNVPQELIPPGLSKVN